MIYKNLGTESEMLQVFVGLIEFITKPKSLKFQPLPFWYKTEKADDATSFEFCLRNLFWTKYVICFTLFNACMYLLWCFTFKLKIFFWNNDYKGPLLNKICDAYNYQAALIKNILNTLKIPALKWIGAHDLQK